MYLSEVLIQNSVITSFNQNIALQSPTEKKFFSALPKSPFPVQAIWYLITQLDNLCYGYWVFELISIPR